jgi:long-chain fatty acid transport protein
MNTLTNSLFLVAGLGGVAWGNAFNINEHDARVTGRGGATAASNTDASSVIFNPGGIPVAEGTQVTIAGSLYIANGSYEPAGGGPKTETDSSPSIVPAMYVTSRITDMIAVGLGVHLPFGLSVSWPERHAQAEIIQDQTLRTYFITPAVGINLDKQVPGLSIGGGIDLVPATIELERDILFGSERGTAVLGGDAFGIGGRVGVMYRPPAAKGLKLGLMYRSAVQLDFEGTGDFDIAQPFRDSLPPDGDISASIELPMSFWGGVAYSPIENLELEANLVWMNWASTWEDDQLRIDLPGTNAMGEPNVTTSPQRYENTTTFRLGAEYALPSYKAAVRAGFIYDPTPIQPETQTAQLPDIDRLNVTIGGSYYFGDFAAHLGLLWVTPGERETSDEPNMPQFKGTYGVSALVTSLTLSGQFGK